MTLTEIRNTVIKRMAAQDAMPASSVTYSNDPTFDPTGKSIWARLSNLPGMAAAVEIGNGPVTHRSGIIIIQLFVPVGSRSLLITETADKLRELFEWKTDGALDYFAVSAVDAGETDGWSQMNLQIPYRAL